MTLARDNPFEVRRLHALRFRFPAGESWETLEQRLRDTNGRGAIVGPHGAGKTQLLEEWRTRCQGRGEQVTLARMNADRRKIPDELTLRSLRQLPPDSWLFIDGAEQLSVGRWWLIQRYARRMRGLVITVHRGGRLPTLLHCAVDHSLLDDLLNELLGADADRWRTVAYELFQQHHGNVRDVWRSLYDRV